MRLDSLTVTLIAQHTYEHRSLERAVDQLLAAAVIPGNLRTSRVLLKPNLLSSRNAALACTDGQFIVAVAAWFAAMGASVAVGDSPAFGSARSVLAATGALPALDNLGVPVVEFRQARDVVLPCGHNARLASAALDCDLLVNLPRVKAHAQMRVTLAVKNLFGCLCGLHKPWWHMVHGGPSGRFAELLVNLLNVLPPGVTLLDGIVAMHRTGPVHGDPYPLGIVACGTNPVALDTALLTLLGIDPRRSPLWRAACQADLDGTGRKDLLFPLATPEELAVPDFLVPAELTPLRFNPLRFIKNSIRRALLRAFN